MNAETRELALEMADRMADRLGRHRDYRDQPVHNSPAPVAHPVVVASGPGPSFDYRAFGEALAHALTPTFNQQAALAEKVETLVEQVAQLAQALVGIEIRPTINVPPAAVSVDLPPPPSRFTVKHDDGSVSTVTVG